jgi:hypothetical protein
LISDCVQTIGSTPRNSLTAAGVASATGVPLTTAAGETDSVLEPPHADTPAAPTAVASSRRSANASLDLIVA